MMNKKIVFLGVFLSIFILILAPNVVVINATIPKEEIYDIKNIERMLNIDCDCHKKANYNDSKLWSPFFLCKILNVIFDFIFILTIKTSYYSKIITRILVGILEMLIGLAIIFNCDWHPNFS